MKIKKIVKYRKLTKELKKIFSNLYKDGYDNEITEFKDPRDNSLHKAVPMETEKEFYLVILDKAISKISKMDVDESELNLLNGFGESTDEISLST